MLRVLKILENCCSEFIGALSSNLHMVEAAHNFEVTSRSNHVISNMTVTKLLAIANFGGFLFSLSFVNDLKHCEQHKYSPFLVNLALGESNNPWSSGSRTV